MADLELLRLTLITDRLRPGSIPLPDLVGRAARAGMDSVQIREKDLAAGPLCRLVRQVLQAVAGMSTRVFVNGRPDVALATGAHGVQLPEQGLPVAAVRRAFPSLQIGASCHSVAAARRAEEGGADFVVFGPVFSTPGKEGRAAGVDRLGEVVRAVSVPVHAVGGIDLETAGRAAAAGARGLAAIRLFVDNPVEQVLPRLRHVARLSSACR